MADKNVGLTASDLFNLGGNFVAQSSTKGDTAEYASMLAANGDWIKWSELFNNLYAITVTYKWNAIAGLGAALPNVGSVANSYLITELGIATNYKDWPTITVTGHQHMSNTHVAGLPEYAVPADIIAVCTGQFGGYDFLGAIGTVTTAEDICVTDSTYTLGMNHIDAECTGGEHWVGTSVQGKESANVNFIGRITLPAALTEAWIGNDWFSISASNDDSNADFNKSNITAERIVTRVP
jgi:hypothetical protein